MARIRTIKPEFFTSEDIVELSPLTRLFYISLWCEADREGRLNWKPKTLKLRYFPGDDKADFECSVSELIETDLIQIYEIDGVKYAQITRFTHHQVINNREAESIIPEIDASLTRESGVQGEGKGKEGKGKEGKGKENAVSRKTPIPKDFEITERMKIFFDSKKYPFDIHKATEQWMNYCKSSGAKYVDWYAAWQNGMAKAHEFWLKDNRGADNLVSLDDWDRGLVRA